jgi:hypothetical protein
MSIFREIEEGRAEPSIVKNEMPDIGHSRHGLFLQDRLSIQC